MTNREIQECIIHQDFYYLIANKPPGISAQEDQAKGVSFHKLLESFCNTSLYVVHRLDRPTSGVIVFAKKKSAATYIGKLLQTGNTQFTKKYLAAVKNPPESKEDELQHFLVHDRKQRKSLVVESKIEGAKEATLSYKTLAQIENYTLLEIDLNTGRFHQIRAQLGAIGSPIKGDVKYGARRGNKNRSINLHAHRMDIPMKEEGQGYTIYAQLPEDPVWHAFVEKIPTLGVNKFEKWTQEQT